MGFLGKYLPFAESTVKCRQLENSKKMLKAVCVKLIKLS